METYPGVDDAEIMDAIENGLRPQAFFHVREAYLSEAKIDRLTQADVTDDRIELRVGRASHADGYQEHRRQQEEGETVGELHGGVP